VGQLLRIAISSLTGFLLAIVLAAVVITASVVVVVMLTGESDSERVTKSIVDLYPGDVKVDKCYEVTDSLVATYSCRVRAMECTRSILFEVVTDSGISQASLHRETDATTATPCAIPTLH
jgi:hypothetical protein